MKTICLFASAILLMSINQFSFGQIQDSPSNASGTEFSNILESLHEAQTSVAIDGIDASEIRKLLEAGPYSLKPRDDGLVLDAKVPYEALVESDLSYPRNGYSVQYEVGTTRTERLFIDISVPDRPDRIDLDKLQDSAVIRNIFDNLADRSPYQMCSSHECVETCDEGGSPYCCRYICTGRTVDE